MRLAQLARKLGVKPADIQAFLAESEQSVELNARLSDDQVLVVVRHMNPSLEASILQESVTSELPATVSESTEPVSAIEEEPTEAASTAASPDAAADEPTTESEPEVIRAPKMELPGLKVVGKIELKEPKKKAEEPLADGETQQEGEPKQAGEPRQERQPRERQSPPMRRQAPPRQWKNPLEVQRQREAREREEQRERELELEKQRRTQKYLKKVKSAPTKPVRRHEDDVVEVLEDTRPAPKTWLGKFARWLTT